MTNNNTLLREGTPAQAGFAPERIAEIRERAASWVADGLTPALVVIAARRGIIALHEAFGQLAPEADSPSLSVDSIFPATSLCKPLTATALMTLVDSGEVELDRRVVDYLGDLQGDGIEKVHVRHLLTHTSGFTDEAVLANQVERLQVRGDAHQRSPAPQTTVQSVLAARNGCGLSHAPDTVMSYCNHGYNLIGEIIRRVSGQTFETFMRERIFEPLQMTNSSLRFEPHYRGRIIKRAQPVGAQTGIDLNDEKWLDIPWASGGLKTTALDVARFAQMFSNGGTYGGHRVVSSNAVHQMTRNQVPAGVGEEGPWGHGHTPEASYGYGWFVVGGKRWPFNGALLPDGTYIHMGMGGVCMWVDPENDIVGVYFSVFTWDDGVTPAPPNPPKLNGAPFQDLVTAAVAR